MTPLFKENDFRLGFQFVTTESLNDALQRSMFQWANNHKYLTFFNVSDKCQPKDGKDCEFAELYIHAKTGGEKYEWAPVKVFHEFREPDSNVTGGSVRTTAGEMIDAKEISKAEVVFFTDHPVEFPDFRLGRQCFYLDETFCVPFQERQKTTNIKLTTEIVCFVLWAIAFLMALKRMLEYVVAYCQKRTQRSGRASQMRFGGARPRVFKLHRLLIRNSMPSCHAAQPAAQLNGSNHCSHPAALPASANTHMFVRSCLCHHSHVFALLHRCLPCRTGYEGVKMLARVHAAHILYSYFTMLMLIFPPAFYWVAAYPCFLCYSFESLAVGAIGQVLGFNYVNAADVQNFKVTEAMGTKTCSSPDNFIEETGVDSASVLMVRVRAPMHPLSAWSPLSAAPHGDQSRNARE